MKYKIIVDYGKPYDISINNDNDLKTELKHLKELALSGDFAYFDIKVLNDKEEDITETQFIQEMV